MHEDFVTIFDKICYTPFTAVVIINSLCYVAFDALKYFTTTLTSDLLPLGRYFCYFGTVCVVFKASFNFVSITSYELSVCYS